MMTTSARDISNADRTSNRSRCQRREVSTSNRPSDILALGPGASASPMLSRPKHESVAPDGFVSHIGLTLVRSP